MDKKKKIVAWLGVSIDNGSHIEVLGRICPRFEGDSEQECKERFIRDRHNRLNEYYKGELEKAKEEHDADKVQTLEKLLAIPLDMNIYERIYKFW